MIYNPRSYNNFFAINESFIILQDLETGITTNATLEVIDVKPGKRYRIRLINAFCTVCPGLLSIQDHKLNVIALDGLDVKPVTVDSITSFAGMSIH